MRIWPIAAALAAAATFTVPSASGSARNELLGMFGFSPSCTPEAHKCEQKLDVLLYPSDEPRHVRIERALLELSETDPECAALLRAMHF